ncbi:serine/threonine protein kinase [PVC group bacterium]|nr:serine/threonine protein kinase [PVC group bacterium]
MSDQTQNVEDLFLSCIELPSNEREGYLQKICGQNRDLYSEVKKLLNHHSDKESTFLPIQNSHHDDLIGTTIDHFKIRKYLGEGGFGVVYLADQLEPIKRKVALKIIKPGMDTRAVLARFETERQTLAMMNHPDIVQIFDGGTTKEGRPYFAMEYVEGIPITEFCDKKNMNVRDRIALFQKVCDATQHAHMKGVIHRDLKPNNILVGYDKDEPAIEIIDFGISKALNETVSQHSFVTREGHVIGTPDYMSPEQAEMSALNVDTRTDIYSLGVILYELLTGQLPLDPNELRKGGLADIHRIIRDTIPKRPSTRCQSQTQESPESSAEIAKARDVDPEELQKCIRGDLDWIIMKCLEKDRSRRYQTCDAFNADIQRYLDDEPIEARPPSKTYRFRKFYKRNQKSVLITSFASILILISIGVGIFFASVNFTLQETAAHLDDFMYGIGDELILDSVERNDTTQLRKVFIYAEESARKLPVDVGNIVLLNVSRVFQKGNLLEDALRIQKEFIDSRFPDKRFRIETKWDDAILSSYSSSLMQLKRYDEAEPILLLLDEYYVANTDELRDFSNKSWIARLLEGQGRIEEAVSVCQECLQMSIEVHGKDHLDPTIAAWFLATNLKKLGKYTEAERYYRQSYEGWRRIDGEDHNSTLYALTDIGIVLNCQDKYLEAELCFNQVLESRRRVLGNEDPETLSALRWLAIKLRDQKKYEEAEICYRELLTQRRASLGPDHIDTVNELLNLASVLSAQNRFEEAEAYYREGLKAHIKLQNKDDPILLRGNHVLGKNLYNQNKFEEAEPYFREALEGKKRVLGDEDPSTMLSMDFLADTLARLEKYAESEQCLRSYLTVSQKVFGPQAEKTILRMTELGFVLASQGKVKEAEQVLLEALFLSESGHGKNAKVTIESLFSISELYITQERYEEAEPYVIKSHSQNLNVYGIEDSNTVLSLNWLIQIYESLDNQEQVAHYKALLPAEKQP